MAAARPIPIGSTRNIALGHQARDPEVRRPVVQNNLHRRDTRARVIRQLPPISQLALENRVDPASGSLDQPDSFERVRQNRISWTGRSYQDVVEANLVRKTTWIRHLDLVTLSIRAAGLTDLDMNGAESGVITVDERVVERLAKSGRAMGGYAYSNHPDR